MSMQMLEDSNQLLYEGADWDYDKIKRAYDAIERIAFDEMGLDIYPNQIEVITAEQMLDAYSSIGMPLMYRHWSFGKRFAQDETLYRKGLRGLAYEIVINSSPCISYIMEENSMTMQTLVIAHAAFGHNHFFKNNNLFRQWTDAKGILDYLEFAKTFILKCEERYGHQAVERVLDAAHALMSHGVHRYPRKQPLDLREEQRREDERQEYNRKMYNDLWRTVPTKPGVKEAVSAVESRKALLALPEENILYFLEKKAPRLHQWQREILRIVRRIAQYFYPQKQTKMMNEGCATYTHYYIMNRLHQKGLISDGAMLEFLHSHTSVVFQPDFDDPRFSGINPYALGFAMMEDIERICHQADRGGPRVVPRHRRQRRSHGDAAGRLGQFPRRELRAPVSQPAPDAEDADVRGPQRRFRAGNDGRGDPQRARLPQAPQGAGPAVRYRLSGTRHPDRGCGSWPATASLFSSTGSSTGSCWTKATPAPSCGTSPTFGATRSCWSRSMRPPTRS